jgi:hypothetical protein
VVECPSILRQLLRRLRARSHPSGATHSNVPPPLPRCDCQGRLSLACLTTAACPFHWRVGSHIDPFEASLVFACAADVPPRVARHQRLRAIGKPIHRLAHALDAPRRHRAYAHPARRRCGPCRPDSARFVRRSDDVGEGVRRSCLKRTDTVPLGWRPSRLRLPN